ncbi:MAG TPA: TspO/MBR family protein [Pilimelia sp.]|nr:TspO/MBR family protein [Pilimelia sp.]
MAAFGLAAATAALIGTLAVTGTTSTYAVLEKPAWAPPSWLFGPVWTVLYALIAIAGWLVWRRVGWHAALVPYAVQLVLNAAWTPIFFGAGAYGWALVDIVAMLLAIAVTIVAFRPISRLAAALLVPYLLWVAYATALNAAIWSANSG